MVLLLLVLICILTFMLDRIKTVYNVTATTELIKCQVFQKPLSRINLYGAKVYTLALDDYANFTEVELFSNFNGSVELSDSVNIRLERLAHGSFLMEFESMKAQEVLTLRDSKSGSDTLLSDIIYVEIGNIDSLINNNVSILIPFTGKVELGKSIDKESDNEYSLVLREGEIVMTGFTSVFKQSFVAGKEDLQLGDKLVFDDENSIGFAVVNEEPAIQVSYRAMAREARIIKPGPKDMESGYKFSASIFSRFKYDKIFQGLSIFIGVVLTIVTLLDFVLNYLDYKGKK